MPSHQKVCFLTFVRARVNTSGWKHLLRKDAALGPWSGGGASRLQRRGSTATNDKQRLHCGPLSSAAPDRASQPASRPASPSFIPRETGFLRLWPACLPYQRRHQGMDRRGWEVNVTERRAAARKPSPARLRLSLQGCNCCKRVGMVCGGNNQMSIHFLSTNPRGEHIVVVHCCLVDVATRHCLI